MRVLFVIIFFFIAICGSSQNDSVAKVEDPLFEIHSPRKATIRSAILPGWGQAYNEKYWKIPIVYAGLGTCVGFAIWNDRKYNEYKAVVIAIEDDDPTTNNTTGLDNANFRPWMEDHRKWLDLSYLSMAGVYILNIIDANVDGHLYHFDVNQDLSLRINPITGFANQSMYTGLSFSLNFK